MATTRLMPLHSGKGRTVAEALGRVTGYVENPEKTNGGDLVSAYQCNPSIADQCAILQAYVRGNHLHVVGEYVDDGWSGTNCDCPSFQRMIDDIEGGKTNCVVTKDLSRLGRNYILTGQHMVVVFPLLGCGFIAHDDGVDTMHKNNELLLIDIRFKAALAQNQSDTLEEKIMAQRNAAGLEQEKTPQATMDTLDKRLTELGSADKRESVIK